MDRNVLNSRITNNGPESFHAHNNSFTLHIRQCLYFFYILTKVQATTYIKNRSAGSEAARSRHDSEKENFAQEKYQQLMSGEVSRKEYVSILSYKYQPLTQ